MRYGQASHPHHNYHHNFHDYHLEYRLSTLDEQVCRVLALNLWPCGEKFLMMNVPLSCHSRITSQNILIKSEVIPAILAVLVIVLDSD